MGIATSRDAELEERVDVRQGFRCSLIQRTEDEFLLSTPRRPFLASVKRARPPCASCALHH